jgi:hypothetical protein
MDAIGNTELDNINICSDQSWLTLSGGSGGSSMCITVPNIYYRSFGSQVRPITLDVANPGALAPGIYYATVTFTSYGAVNSPLKLKVRFQRLASPNEPAPGGNGTGIRLNISNSCSPVCMNTITFGTGAGASEGIDVLFGEAPFTTEMAAGFDTAGPGMRCYAYFKPLNPNADPAFQAADFLGLNRDIRSDKTDTTLIYQVNFNPGQGCYPVKVCVNPADFPQGSRVFLKFTLNGSEQGVDLRTATVDPNDPTQRCVTITDQRINSFYIEYTPGASVNLTASNALKLNSWNLISLPVIPPNPDPKVIFPNNAGGPFLYRAFSSWTLETAMEFGRGYMIRYADFIGPDATISGIRSSQVSNVKIDQGWNSVGAASFAAPVNSNTITLTPNAGVSVLPNLISDVWEFTPQHGYDVSAFLQPGFGYFIKVDASGFYNVSAPAPAQQLPPQAENLLGKTAEHMALEGELSHVLVSDASQTGQDLYFGNAMTSTPESWFEMPSMFQPFDARFASNSGMISFNKSNYIVNLHSSSYPVTLTFSNLQAPVEVRDMTGKLIGSVAQSGMIALTDASVHQVVIVPQEAMGVPTANAGSYSLQNSPNPFFPITTIRYQIPQESTVSLVVYNALGEVVSTLVSEVEGSGVHEAVFDGRGLPSGTYYYTLKAGDFVQTQRMTLNK